jgi:hypothetical protein
LKPRVKGVLPVPRNIFKARGDKEKASKEFLDAATQEPTRTRHHKGRDVAYQDYKARLAETRRRNLKQSVMELHERKVEFHRRMDAISTRKQQEHQNLLNQPERDDERLTNPSVSQDIKDFMAGKLRKLESPLALARRRERNEKLQQAKEAKRKDALHTLYMQARNFITTEQQLDEAIDRVFGTPEKPTEFAPGVRSSSPWDKGAPPTVQEMLASQGIGEASSPGQKGNGSYAVINSRLKKIAEDLTGGKV